MALSGKRKRIIVKDKPSNSVENKQSTLLKNDTYYKNLILDCKEGKSYFIRLRYKGCPLLKKRNGAKFRDGTILIHMNRDNQVDLIYELLKKVESGTQKDDFSKTVHFFRFCDERDIPVDFFNPKYMVDEYMAYLQALVDKGDIKSSTALRNKGLIAKILKEYGFTKLTQSFPSFSHSESNNHPTLDDEEYVKIGSEILEAYKCYRQYINAGQSPEICPHFNESRFRKMGLTQLEINTQRGLARRRVSKGMNPYTWVNNMTKHALMLCYMYTGINRTPLYEMKIKDVKHGFRKGVGDYYELNSVKGRALYQSQGNEIGFTKHTKTFFESWIRGLDRIYRITGKEPSGCDPVFPFLSKTNGVTHFGRHLNPQDHLNKILSSFGYSTITPSIYRKTRSDKLFRATGGDVTIVADANNQTEKTAQQDYLFGADETHQRILTSAFIAQYDMIKGKDKKVAIKEHETRFYDPLKDVDFSKNEIEDTPSGKCNRNHKEYNKKLNKEARKNRKYIDNLSRCIAFWDCFGCPCHGVFVEVDEVHKLLSLRDSLMEKIAANGVNRKVNEKTEESLYSINHILNRLKQEHLSVYDKGVELNRIGPHPLWDNEYAFDDMASIYNG
ncbi:hypothetical protein [Vibrio splendidus]|uniref:hypothetical protein n=1 Tax=Vibrio splendidus TaxID=29497 RepID=UPI000D3A70F9|nr:hypothetical protein [Vibrio splendidus]PTO62407.1 hypothetical protein CWN99_18335 [Vibrio splendidus]